MWRCLGPAVVAYASHSAGRRARSSSIGPVPQRGRRVPDRHQPRAGDLGELVPALPSALQVEVTSACNLRCAMCLVRYKPPVNKIEGALPLDLFRQLLDEVPGLRRLTLQGLGEPLLSPYLLDMVRMAKLRGVAVGFNSNATLLSRSRADELVAA